MGIAPMHSGFADHCLTAWLRDQKTIPNLSQAQLLFKRKKFKRSLIIAPAVDYFF